MKKLVALACLCLAAAALFARFSSAAFTSSTTIAANGVTADALSNYFSITPGSAVQVGTSTPVASGGVDTLGLELGTVPSARPFTNVFRITNVSNSTQTGNLTVASAPQVASAVFASTGAGSVTLAAGASTTVTVTTSATVAGRATGTMRLCLGDDDEPGRVRPLPVERRRLFKTERGAAHRPDLQRHGDCRRYGLHV